MSVSPVVINTLDSGVGTLRDAIDQVNRDLSDNPAKPDEITFKIPQGAPNNYDPNTNTWTISLASPLETITNQVGIFGETQPGFRGTPVIQLSGGGAGSGADGMKLSTFGSQVRALIINGFGGAGIHLVGGGGNTIQDNFIGTDATGLLPEGNVGDGVRIENSPNNTIGGPNGLSRNLISDNGKISTNVPTSNTPVAGLGPVSVASGDFNRDGVSDLVTANSITGDLSVIINNGDGTFPPAVNYPLFGAKPLRVVTGDFDHDGAIDIAVLVAANFSPSNPSGDKFVDVLQGKGDGTFAPIVTPRGQVRQDTSDLAVGDFTGDGTLDLALLNSPASGVSSMTPGVSIMPGLGHFQFGAAIFSPVGITPVSLTAGNITTGDSKLDLVISDAGVLDSKGNAVGQGVQVLVGNGNGTFQAPVLVPAGSNPLAIAIGFFNNDNRPDLAVTDVGNPDPVTGVPAGRGVSVLLGNGNGTFQASTLYSISTGLFPVAVAVGDFNGDLSTDIVTANRNSNDATFLQGNGDGTFRDPVSIATGLVPSGVTTGNFNGGTHTNFAVANQISNTVTVVTQTKPGYGVHIVGAASTGNHVIANIIGADVRGQNVLGNHSDGVRIEGAKGNFIGEATAGAANLISGNAGNGVSIIGLDGTGRDATDNVVEGNNIGVDFTSTKVLANDGNGVAIINASGNTVGGSMPGSKNTTAGNGLDGILISGQVASGNTVMGNLLGVGFVQAVNTYLALPNFSNGVEIVDAPKNVIGPFNTISSNRGSGISIQSPNAKGNMVLGNFIGTDLTGSLVLGNTLSGIAIFNAPGNVVGGTTAAARNLVDASGFDGIFIAGPLATGNKILGNYVGINGLGGTFSQQFGGQNILQGNKVDGILLNGAPGNTIGGTDPGARNVISNNGVNGIEIIDVPGVSGNVIQGNLIGTDATGLLDPTNRSFVGNRVNGVLISTSSDTMIGGMPAAARNVISGNGRDGILLDGTATTRNQILNNYIGTDITGSQSLANRLNGVGVNLAPNNIIGAPGAGNIISGNLANGVIFFGMPSTPFNPSGNLLHDNLIGVGFGSDAAGNPIYVKLGNRQNGVEVVGVTGLVIGGRNPDIANPTVGNIIGGNAGDGVRIDGGSSSIQVVGNAIGTDFAGAQNDLGNIVDGVSIQNSSFNTVGGMDDSSRNLIASNGSSGVRINIIKNPGTGVPLVASGNVVEHNLIGISADQTQRRANSQGGVFIDGGASFNTVGGVSPAARNVIAANVLGGVIITEASDNNVVQNNQIGLPSLAGAGSDTDLGNTFGVLVLFSSGNLIGGAGVGNVIVGNDFSGVSIQGNDASVTDPGTRGNKVQGNFIGTDATGNVGGIINGLRYANNSDGVTINNSDANLIGGTRDAGSNGFTGNVISGNRGAGVHIFGLVNQANVVVGNWIGTGPGGKAIGNILDGVLIENAPGNVIGSVVASEGNLISANKANGVRISGAGASGNFVRGNTIGRSDSTSSLDLANTQDGVLISEATNNQIGGTDQGDRNLISGNGGSGVEIASSNTTATPNLNLVQGNWIGLAASGTAALGNGFDGVTINNAPGNQVGGTAPLSRNFISGNLGSGVAIVGVPASGNKVLGNTIGLDVMGNVVGNLLNGMGNLLNGITITDASNTVIGGTDPGGVDANILSGNVGAGIAINNLAMNTTVQGNLIGTDATGKLARSNDIGVFLNNAVNNIIGGTATGAGNTISGNKSIGVQVIRSSPFDLDPKDVPFLDTIEGNYIGTDATGRLALGDGNNPGSSAGVGVFLNNARRVHVIDNVISANTFSGITIFGQANVPIDELKGVGNVIEGNKIGTDKDGALLMNTRPITSSSPSSGQQQLGVVINTSTGNTIQANTIERNRVGVESTGIVPISDNQQANQAAVNAILNNIIEKNYIGIFLNQTTENMIKNNTIMDNFSIGVYLLGTLTAANVIQGNTITGNSDGTKNPVLGVGIYIEAAHLTLKGAGIKNNVIQDNIISNNGVAGVYLFNRASGNLVQHNTIKKNRKYGVFLYNSAGNVDLIIRKGKLANKSSGNRIADFREFTGPVKPRVGAPTPKGTAIRQLRHRTGH